ncbi:AraC family transcriptional regulator [Kineobactrum salinum]|uniref:Helix-turn-helix transcriptional regulator n=1 Tax=Kineobactrum salinum TaxID=2708301 RepID=A0A6C0U3K0_9GAMM|nr:AraC family transcriptional regulator [Kineobactrum salinum]QIB65557.1 helix-turn-helix transcriptional regulator [Kineobactrum salinum]
MDQIPGFEWYDRLPKGIERKSFFLDKTRRSVSWFLHRLPEATETLSDQSADPVISLELNAAGVVEREVDGQWQSARLAADNLTLTPAYSVCNWHWHGEPLEIIDVYIPHELLRTIWSDEFNGSDSNLNFSPLLQFHDPVMAQLLKSLLMSLDNGHSSPALLRETITHHIIVHMLGMKGTTTAERSTTGSSLPLHILRRVLNYIDERVGEDTGLQDLADVAGISKSHFLRQFRERTGETPYAYLLGRRIEQAASLLTTSDDSITSIAARCGFNDPSHFADTFRRKYHVNPREFRRANR